MLHVPYCLGSLTILVGYMISAHYGVYEMFTELVCDCGERLEGDGYTVVLHCPYSDKDIDVAPDSNPIFCDFDDRPQCALWV